MALRRAIAHSFSCRLRRSSPLVSWSSPWSASITQRDTTVGREEEGGAAVSAGGGGGGGGGGYHEPRNTSLSIPSGPNPDPCDTICIRGFVPYTPEEEVRAMVSQRAGFITMNFIVKGNGLPIVFVKFMTTEQATSTMNDLQGFSPPGYEEKLFIQYARRSLAGHGPKGGGGPPPGL
mmetsp:Transcript_11804/g.34082  ORF Transcript_11804/g.34082 Transcript_11804/m.34082 type:complete len:177 (+) Transcript_11804:414-944(+)